MSERVSKNKLKPFVQQLRYKRIRVCQSVHECVLCDNDIRQGERYFDGGCGRRAHVKCEKENRGAD